jgi:hypothetical protein
MVGNMKRTIALLAVVGAAVLGLAAPASATPHKAIAKMDFTRIVYNPLGRDTTAKLNQEYVRITNHGNITEPMTGWTITDRQGHKYTFPNGYILKPGQVAIVHTGHGVTNKPVRGHLYQNSSTYIWNNGGDTATLRSASGRVYDTCAYRPNGGGLTYCV